MLRQLEKDAGGEILGRLAGLAARPFVGQARAAGVNQAVQGGITRYLNNPIETGLRKLRVDKAVGKAVQLGTRDVPGTPRLLMRQRSLPERQALGQRVGDATVHTLAHNPETLLLPTPDPISSKAYLGAKLLVRKAIGARSMPKLAEYLSSFSEELTKIANGDMLEYFHEHPEKAEARKKRGKSPIPLHLSVGAVGNPKKEKKAYQEDDEDPAELAYWHFDSLRNRNGMPMAERDAFKSVIRKAMEKTAQVLPYQQETQWSCSAACLKVVLGHYGHDISEEEAIAAIGTRPNRGAECNEIAEAARQLGFHAFEYSFDSLDQAKVLLDQDIPIICDIQSFNHPGKGHYVVLVDYSNDQTTSDSPGRRVSLMDPNTPGNGRTLSPEEFEERWWDRAMAPPHDLMLRWGIVVVPPETHAIG